MVDFDVLDPVLKSRGAPQHQAREPYADKSFREETGELCACELLGRLSLQTLEDALDRFRNQEHS